MLIVGMPSQGKFLTRDLIFLTREVWISDQGGGLFCNVDTAFCTPYNLGHRSPMRLNSKTQGWFRAQLDVKLTWKMLKWKI